MRLTTRELAGVLSLCKESIDPARKKNWTSEASAEQRAEHASRYESLADICDEMVAPTWCGRVDGEGKALYN
jgi:hypothetical protein